MNEDRIRAAISLIENGQLDEAIGQLGALLTDQAVGEEARHKQIKYEVDHENREIWMRDAEDALVEAEDLLGMQEDPKPVARMERVQMLIQYSQALSLLVIASRTNMPPLIQLDAAPPWPIE